MRLCPPASVSLPLAAAVALLTAPPAAPAAERAAPAVPAAPHIARPASTCAAPDGRAFPLTTRLHGGPESYVAGGGYGIWYLELTNTTDRTCRNLHPVVVLVDERRALRPSQARLESYAGDGIPLPVRFETTDADELVGALTQALTVGPRRTLTVKLRLAVTSDAVPNRVTANAAVVQRHDDDGDWIGQSNDYRFTIDIDTEPDPGDPTAPSLPPADELARTGTPAAALAAVGALLLTAGGALLLARRRRRAAPGAR